MEKQQAGSRSQHICCAATSQAQGVPSCPCSPSPRRGSIHVRRVAAGAGASARGLGQRSGCAAPRGCDKSSGAAHGHGALWKPKAKGGQIHRSSVGQAERTGNHGPIPYGSWGGFDQEETGIKSNLSKSREAETLKSPLALRHCWSPGTPALTLHHWWPRPPHHSRRGTR